MKATPIPSPAKKFDHDLKLFAKLPEKTKELSALMEQSEKSIGKERAVVTKHIQEKSK